MFWYADSRGDVEVAFTDRHGGVSTGSYASLNLAVEGGDDPVAVAENLRRVGLEFNAGGPVLGMWQVHGADAVVIDGLGESALPSCDGLVSSRRGVALMTRAADCVPVLIADPAAGVIGAAHAGRLGLVRGIVAASVEAMRSQGASELVAWVGPHICGRCYEVPAAMRDEVSAIVPEASAETSWGTPSVDLGAAVSAQLRAAGSEVVDAARCTREHDDLYSYRRDGDAAGRLAGLIRVRP